jgi:hypothetical protein
MSDQSIIVLPPDVRAAINALVDRIEFETPMYREWAEQFRRPRTVPPEPVE